jgi:hypothetical protein
MRFSPFRQVVAVQVHHIHVTPKTSWEHIHKAEPVFPSPYPLALIIAASFGLIATMLHLAPAAAVIAAGIQKEPATATSGTLAYSLELTCGE